jgi:hypothetical protein
MAVNFVIREYSAFDGESGISILRPRMLPCEQPEGVGSIEYQYEFSRQGELVGGLGLLGDEHVDRTSGHPVWTYTLNLTPGRVVRDILRLKSIFGSEEADPVFLESIARGLVMAFAGQTANSEDLRYVALTRRETLIEEGLVDRLGNAAPYEDEVILADVLVPARMA